MKKKELQQRLNNMESAYRAAADMRDHYEELYGSALSELKFYRMSVDFLFSALDEIVEVDDKFAKEIAGMALRRHSLDLNIHNNQLSKCL